jgi:methylglutaconyl-CoA hydratase
MSFKNIFLSDQNSVVEVILNRPEVRNAFNPEMIQEITKAFKDLAKRKDLRAVVLKGEGKAFCAGADLNWMKQMVKYSLAKNKSDSQRLFEMFQAISDCPHPVVGLVHGSVFGGAVGLAACCDIVITETQTQFCFSEVKLGLVPAVISHFVLQKIPLGLTMPWMMLGRVFSAPEAQAMGLVHFIVPETQFESMKNIILNQFGEAGPEAVRETKKLIKKVPSLTVSKAKMETTGLIARRRVSAEGQEGLKAFLDKKSPEWKSLWRVR